MYANIHLLVQADRGNYWLEAEEVVRRRRTLRACAATLCTAAVVTVGAGALAVGVGASTALAGAAGLGGNLALISDGFHSTTPGFASSKDLSTHFQKHGSEFGFTNESDYLKGAQDFISTKGDKSVLVKTKSNGDIVIYNPTTNEFAVTRADGTIKTYFKPNTAVHKLPTNMDYYNAQ